jgi:hypothetical protein
LTTNLLSLLLADECPVGATKLLSLLLFEHESSLAAALSYVSPPYNSLFFQCDVGARQAMMLE